MGLLQPPRRRRGRSGEVAFHQEHVDRLRFIGRALGYSFTLEDIEGLVDRTALVTCGDVYNLATRRLQQMREAQGLDAAEVVALETLVAACARKGARTDCRLLATLSVEQEHDSEPLPAS
jgi:MerR family mercuric resistance operon transcriptional regulator